MIDTFQDPYKDVKISLLVSSKSYDDFYKLYSRFILSPNIKDVELLVKIDTSDDRYCNLLESGPFDFKVIVYPPYNKRLSSHIFLMICVKYLAAS